MGSNNLTARNNRSFMGTSMPSVDSRGRASGQQCGGLLVWSKIQEAEFLGSQPRM